MCINDGNGDRADKVYYLNKILNGIEIFYAVNMPKIWDAEHPLGSVMGRATFGDYFYFYQGCTVGGNNGHYPVIGHHVTMFSGAKVLGEANIGNHVMLAANSYVVDCDIPDNSIVFPSLDGRKPKIKRLRYDEILSQESKFELWTE